MLITLTTDFGSGSRYVAAMKGSLLIVNPAAKILDLTHDLPAQDLIATAYFLTDTLPWFPPRTIHVIVVDPGVGTARALLCVEWNGSNFLVPDNGCWTPLVRPTDPPPVVRRLSEAQFWRPDVSATFHGRDIVAPVAGHVSMGVAPEDLGPRVASWERITLPQPVEVDGTVRGQVVVVDAFGNLLTNLPAAAVRPGAVVVSPAGDEAPIVRTYGDREPGSLVALIGSGGRLELAVVDGTAAVRLACGVGATVEVRHRP